MKTLFQSGSISKCNGKSFAPSSSLAVRTVPESSVKLDKKNSAGKEKNNPAVRRDIRFSPGLFLDYTVFSYMMAVDATLTAEIFVRDRFRTKKTLLA